MKKPNPLFEHLENPSFHDQKDPLFAADNSSRLTLRYGEIDGDWATIARMIKALSSSRIRWYPDAVVAFVDATEVVWDALRLAGLGIAGGVTGLSQVVLAEMDDWLNAPRHHADRAQLIAQALRDGTWVMRIPKPVYPYGLGIRGYMELLGRRRSLTVPLADGSTAVGSQASDKCDTMNKIGKLMGARSQGLAKKGRIDNETKGVFNISDELACLIVITNALLANEESVILTADSDCIEIFAKAMWFLDTHYRAWLAAPIVKSGRLGDPVKELTDSRGCFRGPVKLYSRRTDGLREVLPDSYEPVRVSVARVTPNGKIQWFSFVFERLMLEMLTMRGATNGRCTDLFGVSNIHVDLGPLTLDLGGLYLGIGEDDGITVESRGHSMFISHLDLLHCLHCKERFAIR